VIQAAVDAGFVWLAVVAVCHRYRRVRCGASAMYFDDATDTEPIDARADNVRC
jgi:hypothetical protein